MQETLQDKPQRTDKRDSPNSLKLGEVARELVSAQDLNVLRKVQLSIQPLRDKAFKAWVQMFES